MDTKVEVHVVKMCKAVYRAWSTIQKTKLTYKKNFQIEKKPNYSAYHVCSKEMESKSVKSP